MRSRKDAKLDLVELVRAVLETKAGRCRPPEIADELLEESYPKSRLATKKEGIFQFLREGLIKGITEIVRSTSENSQLNFGDIDEEFIPFIGELHSGRYYVPELQEQLPVSRLIQIPAYLKSAADYMHQQASHVRREAEALDDLYAAVMRKLRKSERPTPKKENVH